MTQEGWRRQLFALVGAAGLLVGLSAPAFPQSADTNGWTGGGDPDTGRHVFNRCRACHQLENSNRPTKGPDLHGIFGRTAGTLDSFAGRYSKALAESGIVWDAAQLDQWLANPRTFLPGNKMSFAGVPRAEDRADLIAYLREATQEQTD